MLLLNLLIISHNTFRHCRARFNASFGQPFPKQLYTEGNGVVLFFREKKLSRRSSLKVLDYSMQGAEGTENCSKFIEFLGLRSLFPLFMKASDCSYTCILIYVCSYSIELKIVTFPETQVTLKAIQTTFSCIWQPYSILDTKNPYPIPDTLFSSIRVMICISIYSECQFLF